MSFRHTQQNNQVKVIKLNSKIYSLEAILSAAYALTDRAYIFLDGDPKKEVSVIIKNKGNYSVNKSSSLLNDFRNSLIHYAIREKISRYNKKIREYIMCRGLYSTIPDFIEGKEASSNKSPTPRVIKKRAKK